MSRPAFGLTIVRFVARLLARSYPAPVRRTYGLQFADVAEHRWHRELSETGRTSRATRRTLRILFQDTVVALPWCWFSSVRIGGGSDDAAPSWRGRLNQFLRGSWSDSKHAVRAAMQRPAFTALVVLTLGVGIGASAAAFDALDRTVLRPLPYRDGDRMVLVSMHDRVRGYHTPPQADVVQQWRDHATTVERFEVYRSMSATRTGHGRPAELLSVIGISAGMPGMFGVTPVAGRLLGAADAAADAPRAVMLTEQFWRREFGADPSVIGQSLQLSDVPNAIIGIWPAGARIDPWTKTPDLVRVLRSSEELPQGAWASIIALLRPGQSADVVEQELLAIADPASDGTARARGDAPRSVPSVVPPYTFLGDAYVAGIWLVFAGSLALLVVSAVNAGHLLAVRASARRLELGVRMALGGSGARLVRLFFLEGLTFALAGIAVGIGMAVVFEQLMTAQEPRMFAAVGGAGLLGRALIFACLVAVVAAVACSMTPMMIARSTDVRDILASAGSARGTGRSSRWRLVFVGAQAALAVFLLTGATLMARSFVNLSSQDTGIAVHELLTLSIRPPAARYPTPEARGDLIARVRRAIETTPGIARVTTSGMPILNASIADGEPYLDGETPPAADAAATTGSSGAVPGYLDTMGIRLIAGRDFQPGDTGVVIVNETFAKRRSGSILGRQLFMPRAKNGMEVIGVVADTRDFGLASTETPPAVYIASSEGSTDYMRFIARAGEPVTALKAARARIAEVDPNLVLLQAETGTDVIRRQTSQHRFVALLLAVLAALGLVLAMAGLYGTVSLDVSQRVREMGLRLALGARGSQVAASILRRGLVPVALGGAVGFGLAALSAGRLEALLFKVPAIDPWSGAVAMSLSIAAAAVASLLPARRASRIDPAVTLRQ